ncbi:MAG TPA: hypothetical protein VEL70_03005 [Candidatus Acidoferrum sp.]|nr:hypothetical protein [Candidatus Acidoferrum sp.]
MSKGLCADVGFQCKVRLEYNQKHGITQVYQDTSRLTHGVGEQFIAPRWRLSVPYCSPTTKHADRSPVYETLQRRPDREQPIQPELPLMGFGGVP